MAMSGSKLTLDDYQSLIKQLVLERGFEKETVAEVFMLLQEETGELAKAIRKSSGMKTSDHSKTHNLEEELADVLWLVFDLANRLNINLTKAFADKEKENQNRIWK